MCDAQPHLFAQPSTITVAERRPPILPRASYLLEQVALSWKSWFSLPRLLKFCSPGVPESPRHQGPQPAHLFFVLTRKLNLPDAQMAAGGGGEPGHTGHACSSVIHPSRRGASGRSLHARLC